MVGRPSAHAPDLLGTLKRDGGLPGLRAVRTQVSNMGPTTVETLTLVPDPPLDRCGLGARCCRAFDRHAPALQMRFWDVPEGLTWRQVIIYRPRYQCRTRGAETGRPPVFAAELPDCLIPNPRVTRRLWEMVCAESHHLTTQEIARRTGLSLKAISKIRQTYEKRLEALFPLQAPRKLGIDEAHIAGHAHAVFVDADAKGERRQSGAGVIDVLRGVGQETIVAAIRKLRNFGNIETFVIDMHRPYKAAIKAARPNSRIVVDRWHAQRLAVSTLTDFRRKLQRHIPTDAAGNALKSTNHMFERRLRDLSAEDRGRVQAWCEAIPALGEAYRAKEAFCAVWDAKDRKAAERALGRWQTGLSPDMQRLYRATIRTIKEWREEILTYFEPGHRVTNGYTEAMNRRIKEVAREGSGLPFESLRARVLQRYGERTYRGAYLAELRAARQNEISRRSQQIERLSRILEDPRGREEPEPLPWSFGDRGADE